jgi:hypothetical protein
MAILARHEKHALHEESRVVQQRLQPYAPSPRRGAQAESFPVPAFVQLPPKASVCVHRERYPRDGNSYQKAQEKKWRELLQSQIFPKKSGHRLKVKSSKLL